MNILVISGIFLNLLLCQGNFESKIESIISNMDKNTYSETINEDFQKITVDVTAYSPTKRETDSSPFTTASNKHVKEGYIAISRDLEAYLGFGDKVFIKDLGIFEVQDRMNRRWQKRVDLFFFDTKEAVRFGKVKKEMWILESKKR
jgi:3D (Asp-Asp-Asp) domain-containing protein